MNSGAVQGAARGESIVTVRNLTKRYVGGDGTPLQILNGVDFDVEAGEIIAVVGQSGAGKSTLLHIIGGLDSPTSGEVRLGGRDFGSTPELELARLRNEQIGFIFQFHHLLREFTALENVMMPQLIAGVSRREAQDRARELLCRVGLEDRLAHKPAQLSGGEQQRVAVARSLANHPLVVLADEPSGNLDPHTGERLHDLLFEVCDHHASAMILVTHNHDLASGADRMLRLEDGQLVEMQDELSGLEPERLPG